MSEHSCAGCGHDTEQHYRDGGRACAVKTCSCWSFRLAANWPGLSPAVDKVGDSASDAEIGQVRVRGLVADIWNGTTWVELASRPGWRPEGAGLLLRLSEIEARLEELESRSHEH